MLRTKHRGVGKGAQIQREGHDGSAGQRDELPLGGPVQRVVSVGARSGDEPVERFVVVTGHLSKSAASHDLGSGIDGDTEHPLYLSRVRRLSSRVGHGWKLSVTVCERLDVILKM